MMHDTENHWDFGLCPSSGIVIAREHNVSETPSFLALEYRMMDKVIKANISDSYPNLVMVRRRHQKRLNTDDSGSNILPGLPEGP
jgi:hypothetical protein